MHKKCISPRVQKINYNLILSVVCSIILIIVAFCKNKTFAYIEIPRINEICANTQIQRKQFHNKFCFTASTKSQTRPQSVKYHKLFSITISNENLSVNYTQNSFDSIVGNYPKTMFCLYHQFPDDFNISISCNDKIIHKDTLSVKEVDLSSDQCSKIKVNTDKLLVLTDFCIDNNDEIILLSKHQVDIKPIDISPNITLDIDVRPQKTSVQWPLERYTSVFTYPASNKQWLNLISSILPIYKGNVVDNSGAKLKKFLVPDEELETYHRISNDYREPVHHRCFNYGVFAKIPFIENNDYFQFIYELTLSYSQEMITEIRDKLTKTTRKNKRIVVDENFAKDYPSFINETNYDVVVLNESMPLYRIADTVHSASYFVFSHLTTGVFSIFLAPGSYIIERKISGAECLTQGERLAKLSNLKYHQIGKTEDTCTVMNLEQYIGRKIEYPNNNCLNDLKEFLQKL